MGESAASNPNVGRAVMVLAFWLFVMWMAFSSCDDDRDDSAAAETATSVSPTSAQPSAHQAMPGDGYHNMGGVDGKDWGIWRSSGAAADCNWSVRLTSPYTGATVLNEGGAMSGTARVAINPPGDVSALTGEINGGRVVFQTRGCGSWTLER